MAIDKHQIIKFISSKRDFLRDEYGVTKIYLFGSFARGEETDESDIDLFVEMPADFFKRCELIEFLEKHFHRKVDVVRKHPNIRKRFLEELEKEAVYV